jgi:hypothetical protein
MKNIFSLLFGISFLLILLLHPEISSADQVQSRTVDTAIHNPATCTCDSLGELRHYKADLLLKEFYLRHEQLQNQENTFLLVRIALMIILIGFSMVAYVKAKSSQDLISRLVILSLIIILLGVYWYDQFILDQQVRVLWRVGEIPYVLNKIPTMGGDQLRALQVFDVLTWPVGIAPKLGLFFKAPTFAQLICYGPIVIVIILLIYRRRTLKRA